MIAIRNPTSSSDKTNFFGLIQINETINDYGNQLIGSPHNCKITVRKQEGEDLIILRYALIPTEDDNRPLAQQLAEYCTPSTTTKWVQLTNYKNVWVLGISTIDLVIRKQNGFVQPTITFSFHSCITLTDIANLEENVAARHHCNIISCNEFAICPTTMETPEPTVPPHGHFSSNRCVRFYEMNTIPPNQLFYFVDNP